MLKINELAWEEGRVTEGYNYLLTMGMVVKINNVRTINV